MSEQTELNDLVKSGDTSRLRSFLRANSTPPKKHELVNALLKAAFCESLPMLQAFIEEGCDVNAQNEEGQTPLLVAVESLNVEIVQFLIQNGADLNLADRHGQTPLHVAVDVEVEKANRGFDLGAAVTEAQPVLINLLIAAGSDVKRKTKDGKTALDWALSRKHKLAERLFKK